MSLDDFPTESELAAAQVATDAALQAAGRDAGSEDLFDFPKIVAFSEAPAAAGKPGPKRQFTESDPGSSLSGEGDLFDAPELEASIDGATRSVAELLARPAPRSAARFEPAPEAWQQQQQQHAATKVTLGAGSAKPLWFLAAAALLLNLGLFAFLWQTSRAFQDTLAEVRAARTQPLELALAAPNTSAPLPSLAAPASHNTLESTVASARVQDPVGFEPLEEVALRLAREELEAGRPAEARLRLFALLAGIDGLERSRREHVEARASFLVAETFGAQTLAAAGDLP